MPDYRVGDEVYARPRDLRIGAFAEYIAIDHADIALKPNSLTMEEAAAVPLVALAAWQALVDLARVKPEQKVLVQPAPAAWARQSSRLPGTWAHTWPRLRAATMRRRCATSAQTN